MSLKLIELSKIVEKAKIIAHIWSKWREHIEPVYDPVLLRFDFAPLIATICDEEVRAEVAWRFPSWLYNRLGNLDLETLLRIKDYRSVLEEYLSGIWPSNNKDEIRRQMYIERVSKNIANALKFFNDKSMTPVTMFEDREYKVAEVYFMLRAVPGIGPKKAFMITRDFAYRIIGYTKYHPWFDQVKAKRPKFSVTDLHFLDPPVDSQAVKVFNRLFGRKYPRNGYDWKSEITPETVQDIHMFARLAFPEMPAEIDDLFWNVGREYCDNINPNCVKCPLREACDVAKRSQQKY